MTCDYTKPPRQGWRTFHCPCGVMWAETTRDYLSPSEEVCPRCTLQCFPIDYWKDESVEVDEWCNLVEPQITYSGVTIAPTYQPITWQTELRAKRFLGEKKE